MIYFTQILISIAVILAWQATTVFLRRRYNQYYQAGFNQAGLQIYNEIKTKGEVTLTLNGQSMAIGEIVEIADSLQHES